jgi:hypothetical protein
MSKSFFKYLLFAFVGSAILLACVKKNSYPTLPEIEYKDFFPYVGDSADLQVKFTDGDGDIGVNENDSTRTFWVTYYYKDTITNKYVGYYRPLFNDTLRTGYIIKLPEDSTEASLLVAKSVLDFNNFAIAKKIKNVKYVIYLYDAAGNKSNVITSPEITVP